jgi:hypothetical protein
MSDDRPSWAAEYIRQHCEKCPVCGSIWSKTVKRCTCGYDFETQAMGPPSSTGSFNWLWPDITDSEGAAAAGREGAAASFVIAGITAIFAVLAFFGVANMVSPWALIDAGVMAVLGLFIRRMSRVAALAALAWFIVARIQGAVARGFASNVLLGLILLAGFVSGIRGTIAYHQFAGKRNKFALTLVFTSPAAKILRQTAAFTRKLKTPSKL